MPGEVQEAISKTLDSINPPIQVEQTRRADGFFEHNPDMEIPGWGFSDVPDFALEQGPASAPTPATDAMSTMGDAGTG